MPYNLHAYTRHARCFKCENQASFREVDSCPGFGQSLSETSEEIKIEGFASFASCRGFEWYTNWFEVNLGEKPSMEIFPDKNGRVLLGTWKGNGAVCSCASQSNSQSISLGLQLPEDKHMGLSAVSWEKVIYERAFRASTEYCMWQSDEGFCC